MKNPGTGCLSAFAACKNRLLAQFLRTTSKSAVVLIPQCCFFVICSLPLQTSLSYQYLIPVQSVDLVLMPLAPACVKGDTNCAKRGRSFGQGNSTLLVWGSDFPPPPCGGGRKDPQMFLLPCVWFYHSFTHCRWLVRCTSAWLSPAVLRRATAMWDLSHVYVNGSNCSTLLKDRERHFQRRRLVRL